MYFSVILALIAVLLIRRRRRNSRYSKTIVLKSYSVKPSFEESNHECFYPNPTYQDIRAVDNNTDVTPNPTFQDVQQNDDTSIDASGLDVQQDDDKNTDVSRNPTFQDVQDEDKERDNEFSVQLENVYY